MTVKGYTVSEVLGLQVLSEYGESARKEIKSIAMPKSGAKGFIIFSVKGINGHDDTSSIQTEEFKKFVRDEFERRGLKKKPSIDTYYEIPKSVTVGELLDVKSNILEKKMPNVVCELYVYVIRNGDFFLL